MTKYNPQFLPKLTWPYMRTYYSSAICIAIILTITGCGPLPYPGVYKIDIQQGNVIDTDMLSKLKPNMEKRKVRFILGSPSVSHLFDPDRWDYIYSFQTGDGVREQRHIILLFKNDRLTQVLGNVTSPPEKQTVPVPESGSTGDVVLVPDQKNTGILTGLNKLLKTDETKVPKKERAATPIKVTTQNNAGYFSVATETSNTVSNIKDGANQPDSNNSKTPHNDRERTSIAKEMATKDFFGRLRHAFYLPPPTMSSEKRD